MESPKEETAGAKAKRFFARAPVGLLVGAGALGLGFAIFFAAGAIADARRAGPSPRERAPLVETVAPTALGLAFEIEEEGFLRPAQEVDLVAEIAGRVIEVSDKLRVGGRFDEGEVIARIDPTPFEAELSRAKADAGAARAELAEARADYQRQEGLQEIGAASDARLEQARARLRSAEARVAQADAAVTIAQKQFRDTELRAPFAAKVQSETISVGQYLSPGMAVARLFDAAAAEVQVALSPRQAAAVRRAWTDARDARKALIAPTGSSALTRTLEGEIIEVASALDPQTRTVDVLIRIENAFSAENDGAVFAQDFVTARMSARSDEPLFLASDAVVRKQRFAWTVNDEKELERVDITPVDERGREVVFATSAPLEGQRLVTTALTEESAGMKVRITEDDGDDGANAPAAPEEVAAR